MTRQQTLAEEGAANARLVILAQVELAWSRHNGDMDLPDLDDEQPFTLQVRTTLGDLRNLRRYRTTG